MDSVVVASYYGFPVSHPERETNEAFLRDIISYMGRLICPSIMVGDLNDHLTSSPSLARAPIMNMHRVTDDSPTTLNKQGVVSGRTPLDHCLANLVALESGIRAKVDPTLVISDHLPILLDAPMCHPKFLRVVWSSPPKTLKPQSENPMWQWCPCDYASWQETCRAWLQQAHRQSIQPKGCMTYMQAKQFVPSLHVRFRRLFPLQRAVVELCRYPRLQAQQPSIARKLAAQDLAVLLPLLSTPDVLLGEVQKRVQSYMKNHHRAMIKKWREISRSWKVSDAAVYAYLRNPMPNKLTGIILPNNHVVTHPWRIQEELLTYWNRLETWDSQELAHALEVLEDRYSILLPHQECQAEVLPRHLMEVARSTRKSMPGLDAWTHAEMASLPIQAWQQLLDICARNPWSLLSSLTSVFRRAPIPKVSEGVCLPGDVRPIDLFSVILHILASATTGQLRYWTICVMHPGQYATQGGVLLACARIAWASETSLLGLRHFSGVSVDFEKMFNMLSIQVAMAVGLYMGLTPQYVSALVFPIMCATGVWSFPFAAAPLPCSNSRGLPQGMSTSVLLAELAISPLLWRITRSNRDAIVCAYVDDLNLLLESRDEMLRVVDMLREFESDFALRVSQLKTRVWATSSQEEPHIVHATGCDSTAVLDALGGQWQLQPRISPSFPKECARLDKCMDRLIRARALQINPARLAQIISTGCLSLLDYLNLPDHKPYLKVRTCVKDAFDIRSAAPEVLTCVLQPGTIDPVMRWLAILRVWFLILKTAPEGDHVNEVIEAAKGRLGRGAIQAFRWGVRVTHSGLEIGTKWLSVREEWFIARKVLTKHLKDEQARRLSKRRPHLFGGLTTWNPKQHAKFVRSLPPLQASILLKLWTGSIMCKHKRQQLYGESPQCACGHADQTVQHLLWTCPLVPPPPPHLEHRRHLMPSQSVAHLLPEKADNTEVQLWRDSCQRAIKILAAPLPNCPPPPRQPVDMKGHVVATNLDGTYSFCRKCFISRRARDTKWIWTKRCPREHDQPRSLGEIWESLGHDCGLQMARWKNTSQRPIIRCTRCQQQAWATCGLREECQGEG